MDFNAFIEEFASLVAVKVARELRKDTLRRDWPAVEPKEENSFPNVETKENTVSEDNVDVEPEDDSDVTGLKAAMGTPKLANSKADARRSELSRVNIRTLRNKIAVVESNDPSSYSHLSKDDLVNYIVNFESLIGRTVEEEQDRLLVERGLKVGPSDPVEEDNDFSEPEPEDDTDAGELTREEAERLSLRELKVLALANEVPEADLEGKDIKAVVDLLFGEQKSTEPPVASEDDADDEEGITEEEINAMSLSELKGLIEELNEQGADISYNRGTSRGELIDLIFDALEEVEDE